MSRHARPDRHAGYALVTAIVFLVLLTLVALAAIRGTGLELRSTANANRRAEAFAASETTRTLAGRQVDALCRIGGIDPTLATEALADARSAIAIDPALAIQNDGNWCTRLVTVLPDPTGTAPDAIYTRTDEPIGHGAVWVRRVWQATAPGTGQAAAAGYGGVGIGAANAGAQVYFDLYSVGADQPIAAGQAADAGYSTAATWRHVVRR